MNIRYSRRFFAFSVVAAIAATAMARQAPGNDWPQWRGPTRDGIAPTGPKLSDVWPAGGPKLLWKTAGIPSGPDGGVGSIVVADGRAFVFVNSRRPKSPNGKVVLTAEVLSGLGWAPGVPKDLAAKIEAARLSEKRAGLTEAGINDYIRDFLATIDSHQAAKFGSHIRDRLTKGRDGLAWDALEKLAAHQDHEFLPIEESFKVSIKTGAEFAAQDEFNKVMNDIFGGYGTDAAKQQVARALFHYTDYVVCLDAATGRQLWKSQEFPEAQLAAGKRQTIGGPPEHRPFAAANAMLPVAPASTAWTSKTGRWLGRPKRGPAILPLSSRTVWFSS